MTRGERLNNPGCIRRDSTKWVGLASVQSDPDFFEFKSPEYGLRAIAKILQSYHAQGVKTLRAAVQRWAPPSENNTDAYVAAVCRECGIGADQEVDLSQILPKVMRAIVSHENGRCVYSEDQIQAGIALAATKQVSVKPMDNSRSNTVQVALVAALVVPKVQKLTGITLTTEDVASLAAIVVVVWYWAVTTFERYFPPPGDQSK